MIEKEMGNRGSKSDNQNCL